MGRFRKLHFDKPGANDPYHKPASDLFALNLVKLPALCHAWYVAAR